MAKPRERTIACQGILHCTENTLRISGERRVVQLPISSDAALIARTLRTHDVRYLVIADRVPFEYFEPDEETRLDRLQRSYPSLLYEVHRGRGYRVFAVNR